MLLHFGYTTAEMTSAEAIDRTDMAFRRELKHPYSKSGSSVFEELRSRMHLAEVNAKRLIKWHESQNAHLPSRMNPCAKLHEITTMLSDYIEGDEDQV